MPKMVVYELFSVTASSPEAAIDKAKEGKRKGSILVAAKSLEELTHPIHLADAQSAFGTKNG